MVEASILLAVVSLFVSLAAAYRAYTLDTAPWKRPFNALEHDFEELREQMMSQLGRISRLKRDVQAGKIDVVNGVAPSEKDNGQTRPFLSRRGILAKFGGRHVSSGNRP